MTESDCNSYRPDETTVSTKALWLGVVAAFALLYLFTCQRSVSWQDSGEFQWRVMNGDYRGSLGLALAHPLYIAAGKLFCAIPVGNLPERLNFFSGLGLAVACGNIACVATVLTRRRWIGAAAAAMLGLAHTAWWLGTIAEVYTWVIAGFSAELWMLVSLLRRPRWSTLAGLALVNGLGLCVHNFALLPLPVYVAVSLILIARKRLPAGSLGIAAAAYLVGASPYLALIAGEIVRTGDVAGAIRSALFGSAYEGNVLNTGFALTTIRKVNFILMALNLAGPQLLCVLGAVKLRRRVGSDVAWPLWALAAIQLVFVLRYNVPDQFTFFLPSLVMLVLLAAVGLGAVSSMGDYWQRWAMLIVAAYIAFVPAFYASLPTVARQAGFAQPNRLPYRDEARYWLVPWKQNERSAEMFAKGALTEATHGSVILADSTSSFPLRIVDSQAGGQGPHVLIQDFTGPLPSYGKDPKAFRTALGSRTLYVVRPVKGYVPEKLLEDATFVPEGNHVIYRVIWKKVMAEVPIASMPSDGK